jgi:1-deoxy-D-xylulose-5-phosphate reductoisomerase
MRRKKIVILGSTGSIGENAVKVAELLPEELEVVGLAANRRVEKLARQAAILKASCVVSGDESRRDELKSFASDFCEVSAGAEALVELVTRPEVELVLCAIVGTAGLAPVLAAIKAGKDIAIASKEVLVAAGEIVMEEVKRAGVKMLPVDSEHSAVFQCLEGRKHSELSRIILTASGGPFRNASLEQMRQADYKAALDHPTWNMGPKVTIDSASLMNKALEIIEARWLFDVPGENIDVVIHPQSLIHSMTEFVDGTVLAQMSSPDMRFPIQYALTYPDKLPGSLEPLDFAKFNNLTFETPDHERFPSLNFAYEALRQGGTMPAVMNAANEVAVERFKEGGIRFTDIWNIIEKVMSEHKTLDRPILSAILSAEKWAAEKAKNLKI